MRPSYSQPRCRSEWEIFRNRLRNGTFRINQRAKSGTVTLAAGVYGHDGWKAGADGCTYTFAGSGIDTTLTISSGTLLQIVEGAEIEGGTYALSWSGTATGRIYQGSPSGSYAASPLRANGLTANTNTIVEFGTGTLGLVQFEPDRQTPFERRPLSAELALCQRHYFTYDPQGEYFMCIVSGAAFLGLFIDLPVAMRAVPTVTISGSGTFADTFPLVGPRSLTRVVLRGDSVSAGQVNQLTAFSATAEL